MFLLTPTNAEDKSFVRDASSLAALKALDVKRVLALEESAVLNLLSADPAVLRRRQAIFRDLETPGTDALLRRLREYVKTLRELAQKRAAQGRTTEDVLYSFGEVTVFIEMIRDITDAMAEVHPESDALRELFALLDSMAADPKFAEIEDYVAKLSRNTKFARSITLGVNLDASFNVREVGVAAVNDDYYTASDLFTAVFGAKPKEGDLRCIAPLVWGESSAGLNQAVYNALNDRIARSFLRARSVLLEYIQSVVSELYPLAEELNFLIRANEFCAETRERGGRLCVPSLSADTLSADRLWNPSLLRKMPADKIVASGVSADGETSILLITGPNSGGKSVYLKSVGLLTVMAQLGMPVCARAAEVPLFTRFFCHFPAEDSPDDSRLVEECRAMREILDTLDASSLLLMDETFSGTASAEGAVIAGEVLKTVRDRGAVCVFSTHLHDLASASAVSAFNVRAPRMKTLSAEYSDGRRTYRIVEQPDDGESYAYEIAERYGLRYVESGK